MPLVVDASALVEYVLHTAGYDTFAPLIEGSEELHIPALCDVEVASALRNAVLSKAMTDARAAVAVTNYTALPLTRHGHVQFIPRLLELRHNFSAYDAVYVALAEQIGAALLTGDARLARAVRRHLPLQVLPER